LKASPPTCACSPTFTTVGVGDSNASGNDGIRRTRSPSRPRVGDTAHRDDRRHTERGAPPALHWASLLLDSARVWRTLTPRHSAIYRPCSGNKVATAVASGGGGAGTATAVPTRRWRPALLPALWH